MRAPSWSSITQMRMHLVVGWVIWRLGWMFGVSTPNTMVLSLLIACSAIRTFAWVTTSGSPVPCNTLLTTPKAPRAIYSAMSSSESLPLRITTRAPCALSSGIRSRPSMHLPGYSSIRSRKTMVLVGARFTQETHSDRWVASLPATFTSSSSHTASRAFSLGGGL